MPQYDDELGAGLGNNPAPVSLGQGVNQATQVLDEPTVDENLIRQQLIERGDFTRARGRRFSNMTPDEFEGALVAGQAEAAKPRRADGTEIEERSALGRGMSNLYNQAAFAVTEDPKNLMAVNENQHTKSAALRDYEEEFKKEAGEVYTEKEGFAENWGSQLGDVAWMMAKEPGHATDMLLEQVSNSIPSLALSAGGMAAGAAVGAKIGAFGGAPGVLLGTVLGGVFGLATGGGVGSGLTEYSAEKVQQVTQRVKDPTNINEVIAAINDPKVMSDSERAAFLKAKGVGVTDFVTSLMTGGLSRIPGLGKAAKVALGSTVELAGEPIGEYAGQALQKSEGFRDEIDYGDVVMEGALGGGQSMIQATIANSTKFGVAATAPLREAQALSTEQKVREQQQNVDPNKPFKNDFSKVVNPVGAARERAAQANLPAGEQRDTGEVLFSDVNVAKSAHRMNKYADHYGTRGLGNKYVQESFDDLVDTVLSDSSNATSKQEARDAIDGFIGTVKGYSKEAPVYREGATASDLKAIDDESTAPYRTAMGMQDRYKKRLNEEASRKLEVAKTKAEVAKGKLAANANATGTETGTKPAPEKERTVTGKTVANVKGKDKAVKAAEALGPTSEVVDKGDGNFEVTKTRHSDDPAMTDNEVAAEIKGEAAIANQPDATLTVEDAAATKEPPQDVVEDNIPEEIDNNEVVTQDDLLTTPVEDEKGVGQGDVPQSEGLGGRDETSSVPAVAETTKDAANEQAAVQQVGDTNVQRPETDVGGYQEAPQDATHNVTPDADPREFAIDEAQAKVDQANNRIADFKSRDVQSMTVKMATATAEKQLAQASAELKAAEAMPVDTALVEEFLDQTAPITPVESSEPAQAEMDTLIAPEAQKAPKGDTGVSNPRLGKPRGDDGYANQRGAMAGIAKRYPGINMDEVTAVQDKKTGKWFLEVNPDYQMPAEKGYSKPASQPAAPVEGETQAAPNENLAKFEKLHDKLANARASGDVQKAMAAFAKARDHANTWFPGLNLNSLKDYDNFATAIQMEEAKRYNRPAETPSDVVYDAPTESGAVQKEAIKATAEVDASFVAQLNQNPPLRVDREGSSIEPDEVEYNSKDLSTPLVLGDGAEARVFWNGSYVPVNELELGAREQLLKDHTLLGDDFDVDAAKEDNYEVYDAKVPSWANEKPKMGEPDADVVSDAKILAKRIFKASGHKVVVVSSKEDFIANNPKAANKLLEKHPTLGGYYDKVRDESVIWVWPGNTTEDINRVILHETVGHGGMENLFGNKWLNFINKVIDTNMKALIDSFANTPANYGHKSYNLTGAELAGYRKNKKALGYDWVVIGSEANGGILKKVTRKHAQMLIREHIARQAERFVTDPQLLDDLSPGAKHWFHRVMAYVRHLLRPYVKFKVTDADILSLLAESHDRTVEGKNRSAYMEEVGTQKANEAGDLMSERYKSESDDIWKDRWEKDSKRQLREDDEWNGIYASDGKQSANENNAAKAGVASTKGHNAVDVSVVTDDMRAAESQVVWLDKARQGADRMLRSLRNVPYIGKLMHNKLMPGAIKFEMLNRVHKGRVDTNARRATQLHKMLAKLPADQLKKISDAWTGGEAFSALGLNPPQVALLTQGRKDLEDIQQMLNTMTYKGHKILSDDQLEETGGKFLHTEYMAYLAAYRGSGKTPSGFDWMKRRTATKATEAQLEKISNASYTIPSTLGLVGRDAHLLRFMEDVAENANNKEGPAWVVDSSATFKVGLAGGDQNMTINQIRHEMDRTATALNQERMAHVGTNTEAKAILESNLDELNRVYSEKEETRLDNVANAMYQSGGKYARVTPSGNVQEKLVQDIPREEKEAFLEENFVWVTEKSHPNLLPFQGKYVHKEIINEFTQMDNSFEADGVQRNGFAKAVGDATASGGILDSTTRAWKLSKTGLNIPAYYMRNLVGNFFLLDISTSTNAASLTVDVGKEALATLRGNGKKYGDHTLKEWADQFGLYSTTYGASELYFLADDFERQMKKDVAKKNNKFMKMAGYEIADSAMWLAGKTADMHGLMEGIFKQVVMKDYIARWEKGDAGKGVPRKFNSLSATEQMGLMAAATEEAGNAIFDYDKVPNWARTLRRTPFGTPFMTFNYKMAGALPRAMLKHPWKMARYYAAPGMASAALMATGIADFDDDEMEEITKKVPWYMRNKSGFLIMPLKDSNGKVQYFDLTYIFPPTLFTDAYLKMMNQGPGDNIAGSFKDLAFGDLGLLGGPVPQALTAGLANKDPFTGRDIWVDGDLPVNNWERLATWMWNMAMPPVLTEGGALGRSFNQAGIDLPMISSGQEFTKYGTDKETGAQTFWRGIGLSGGGFSPAESMKSNEKRFSYKLNQVQKAMRKAAVDPNKDRMERISAVRAYEAQIREMKQHRMRELSGR